MCPKGERSNWWSSPQSDSLFGTACVDVVWLGGTMWTPLTGCRRLWCPGIVRPNLVVVATCWQVHTDECANIV
eukprot:4409653-Amphidinium_carterae.1